MLVIIVVIQFVRRLAGWLARSLACSPPTHLYSDYLARPLDAMERESDRGTLTIVRVQQATIIKRRRATATLVWELASWLGRKRARPQAALSHTHTQTGTNAPSPVSYYTKRVQWRRRPVPTTTTTTTTTATATADDAASLQSACSCCCPCDAEGH